MTITLMGKPTVLAFARMWGCGWSLCVKIAERNFWCIVKFKHGYWWDESNKCSIIRHKDMFNLPVTLMLKVNKKGGTIKFKN